MSDKELNSTITFVALKKAITAYLVVIIAVPILQHYNVQTLIDDDFLDKRSYFYQLWYMNILISALRCNYYYAWTFGEAVCNNAGLGLNGFDKDGQLRIDLVNNINISKIETASNMTEYSKCWNSTTIRWMRFVAYDRVPYFQRLVTYLLSTLWHGFHPNYYISAFHGTLYVYASLMFRKYVRPHVLGSTVMKVFYDLLSIIATRYAIIFMAVMLALNEVEPQLKFYRGLYYIQLVLTILAIILPPLLLPVKKTPPINNIKENESDKNKIK